MKKEILRLWLLLILAGLAQPGWAQVAEENSAAADKSEQAVETEQKSDAGDNSEGAPVAGSKERFIPTEEISEDLSVSFPVDI